MTETKKDLWDMIFKIAIAVIVPITVAIIGIYGQKIISDYGANEQALERLVRYAEAETAFRQDLFASLFNEYVNQISDTDDPVKLDALTTRLELLSSNFSNFIKLRPLFLQLDRQINRLMWASVEPNTDIEQLRRSYQKRLDNAARAVIDEQVAQIYQHGKTIRISALTKPLKESNNRINWPTTDNEYEESNIELNGVTYHIELVLSGLDQKRRQVDVNLKVFTISLEDAKNHSFSLIVDSRFKLDSFAFPLEVNSSLPNSHRIAFSLDSIDDLTIEFSIHLFRYAAGSFEDINTMFVK